MASADDLAIVGLSCRFPGGSNSVGEFWQNLLEKRDCVRPVPADRWNGEYFTDPSSNELHLPGKIPSSRCGWIDHVGEFDYETFAIGKREAENMDPQQKLLLEVAFQALEDSGIGYAGAPIGVYVGIGQAEQYELSTADLESINAYSVTGSALSIAANRLSYCFDLRGPSMSIDTACSSSLTAFHLACQSVRDGTCSAALVAGVNIILNPSTFIQFSQLGVLSPDGICQSFSNKANGYVRSEGCGVVIVKSLKEALRDRNYIYCRIRGSAINQDGHLSPSLTMPSSHAQMEVFEVACRNARVEPKEIFYVEAHATGTKVGDPTEANAIGKVFGRKESQLRLGSVKSNVGHLETASFMAGLFKCILMLEHQQLVGNLHFTPGQGNAEILFDEYQLTVQTENELFENPEALMMVSSFGFGGANGCAIIQGYRSAISETKSSLPQLFLLSAATPQALEARIEQCRSASSNHLSLERISSTLYTRSLHRLITFAIDEQLTEKTAFLLTRKRSEQPLTCIWVFAGQGPQHPKMGKLLYAHVPSFRQSIDASDLIYRQCSGQSLVHDVGLFGPTESANPMAVYQIEYTLPSLVFLQIALVDMYEHLGVPCAGVFGHSFGEMAAGYAAKICTRKQCVETAFHRARILREIDGCGTMLAVSCSKEYIQPLLDQHEKVWIAAYNGPNSLTLGGIKQSIASISDRLTQENIFNRILKINSAFHTPLMSSVRAKALAIFKQTLAGVSEPVLPYFSTVTGQWKEANFDENYTFDGIESPVLFDVAVQESLKRFGVDSTVFLEIAAHPVLSSYLSENGSKNNLCTLHRQQSDIETTLKTLANLRIYGYSAKQIDLAKLYSPGAAPAPLSQYLLYPFQRQACLKEDPGHRLQRTVPVWFSLGGRPVPHPYPTYQTKLSLKTARWIEDHCVQGPVVFPAAGYIEICMEVFNSMNLVDIQIQKALVLPSDAAIYRTMRIVLDQHDQTRVTMYSKFNEYDSGNWTEHMHARKGEITSSKQLPAWLEKCQSRCSYAILEQKDIYSRFSSVGLDYGPHFQSIKTLHQGDHEAYAYLNIAHLLASPTPVYKLHPGILDCTFQVLLGTQRYFSRAYVPTVIKQIHWLVPTHQLPEKIYVYARTNQTDFKQVLIGDIYVVDEKGELIGSILGFEATALGQSNRAQPLFTLHYQTIQLPTVRTPISPIAIPQSIKEQEDLFDQACCAYIASFLHAQPFDSETVAKWPVHRQRYWQWLHSTIESKTVQSQAIASIDQDACQSLQYEAQAVHRVGKNLPQLLNDNFAVQTIFFGENDPFMSDLYAKSMTFQPYVEILAEKLVQLIRTLDQHSSRVFSILELGAGTGALTSAILDKLASQTTILQENRLIYVFTDVSPKFLSDAKKQFSKKYPCLQYQLCNLDKDFAEQHFTLRAFDFVCAFDVIHVAQDLQFALRQIKQLLKPQGYVLAIELTRPWTWVQLFFGLFSAWWNFTDTALRSTCFLSTKQWTDVLSHLDFHSIQIENEGQPEFSHSLLTAQISDWTHTERSSSASKIFDATAVTRETLDCYMGKLLELAQSVFSATEPARIFVLTVTSDPPLGASFTGFARVWANECLQHQICSIEFHPTELANRDSWLPRVETIVQETLEREFLVDEHGISVPRHVRRELQTDLPTFTTHRESHQPFRLEIDTVGQLQTLKYRLFSPPLLAENDVQVAVHASALNFKDLMLALGMLDNPTGLDQAALAFQSTVNLGLEFSGVVTGVGSSASKRFALGEEVFGFANHCFSSQVTTHEDFVVAKPAQLSHLAAVSLPIVFVTVYAGLVSKAHVQRDELVLIHSAAGGVGQAAIQLCQQLGAKVICTVGSPEKREFLSRTYGCQLFANSHSTEQWRAEVMQLTGGRGVDVVLNSLKGEAIAAGLACLKTGGRFVEIGKVDILSHAKLDMHLFLRDLSFLSVQVDILMGEQTGKIQEYLRAVRELAAKGCIQPIVDQVYPLQEAEGAFRFLMSGQHKGKLILDHQSSPPDVHPSSTIYDPAVTYLLSGGTGALGLQLLEHMSVHGARRFVLLSRQGTKSLRASDRVMMEKLGRFAVQIYIGTGDIGVKEDIARVLAEAEEHFASRSSRYSLLHLAMVLDDAPISKLTPQRLKKVMECKVQGAMNLLEVIPRERVEKVVFFSSAASTFGNPSQANYSAANGFLDQYAYQLSKASRMKVRVLNLGLVEDVGILAEDWKLKQILMAKGFAGGLTSTGVAKLLDHVFLNEPDEQYQFLYGNFQFEELIQSYPILKTRFEHLIDYSSVDQNQTMSNSNEISLETLSAYISTLLATSNLDANESLTLQGLDSLIAVELSAGLKKQFGLAISQLTLLGGLSIQQILQLSTSSE